MATRKEKCSTFKINVSVISSDMDAKAETVNTRYVRDDPRVDDKAPSNRGQTNVLCRTCAAVLFITSGGFLVKVKKKEKNTAARSTPGKLDRALLPTTVYLHEM